MNADLDDFLQRLHKIREDALHLQKKQYYSPKMTDSQAKIAGQVMSMLEPLVQTFVSCDKQLRFQEKFEPNYVQHIVYDNSKHCRLTIGAASNQDVYVNAMVGGSFNLQHMAVYSGRLDETAIIQAVEEFLSRCYRFLLTGQLA